MTVLLLIGPTAAGKSEVAVAVAEAVGGEIISADARAIYWGLEIGTDRPPREILARVPHHLVGTLDPLERYDAARFRADCERLVSEIQGRGHRAIIAGGSTLYVRALTRGLSPGRRPTRSSGQSSPSVPPRNFGKSLHGWIQRPPPGSTLRIGYASSGRWRYTASPASRSPQRGGARRRSRGRSSRSGSLSNARSSGGGSRPAWRGCLTPD